jgi:pimeloyl-ACP methyl ester carboxylesterase
MRIAANGLTFDVRVDGPAYGPLVLLLHGFPQNGAMWDAVTPALHAAGLRTAAPDQRGYSPGARPPEADSYKLEHCAADALSIVDALGVDAFHLVGHDWGALVGWSLAGLVPGRVRTFTAISVAHPYAMTSAYVSDSDQRQRSSYIRLFRTPDEAERVLLTDDGARLREIFAGSGLDAAGVARYVAPLLEPGALTGALNWYRAMDLRDAAAFPRTAVPTTYIWGEEDIAVGRAAAEACSVGVTGEYRFVPLPGVSHWVPDEVPDIVADEVLARVGAASADGPARPAG